MSISPVFNVQDLFPYRGTFEPPIVHASVSAGRVSTSAIPVPPRSLQQVDQVEDVLEDEIIGSRHGGFQRYLIKWKDRPVSDATWILEEELRHLAPDILEHYHSRNSTESSSFQPGGNDGDHPRPKITRTYMRRGKKP
ncbi:hypothetical protein Vadar_027559 [Vaccinium darrowii]|uniref:Uncharacterized protein n=1 Tax=Vaccinium darrowii TaxID=229202 RepID=A0ACB7ZN21_9ERIC|nr:hypothetical protein Vadar_027559 [Vaccinium darrowii]